MFVNKTLAVVVRAILISFATAGPRIIAINTAYNLNESAVALVVAFGILAEIAPIFPINN
jgi:hypothetical protein